MAEITIRLSARDWLEVRSALEKAPRFAGAGRLRDAISHALIGEEHPRVSVLRVQHPTDAADADAGRDG